MLLLRGRIVSPVERVDVCRDPKDNMFLEAALTAEADGIVSGDEDLLVLDTFRSIPVIGLATFLQMIDHFEFYNGHRRHQSLSRRTPNEVYWATLAHEIAA